MAMYFADRRDAGRQLADRLDSRRGESPIVIGMARGGVPVAAEIAERLDAPLDVIVVRKIGCPWQPELGVGALAEGGALVRDDALIAELAIAPRELEAVVARERRELARRVERYRADRPPLDVAGRTVILVDDGLATGGTARAAILALRERGASPIVLAVPVAPGDTVRRMQDLADEVVVLATPDWFGAIGLFYLDFGQTSDEEVVAALTTAAERVGVWGSTESASSGATREPVS